MHAAFDSTPDSMKLDNELTELASRGSVPHNDSLLKPSGILPSI